MAARKWRMDHLVHEVSAAQSAGSWPCSAHTRACLRACAQLINALAVRDHSEARAAELGAQSYALNQKVGAGGAVPCCRLP